MLLMSVVYAYVTYDRDMMQEGADVGGYQKGFPNPKKSGTLIPPSQGSTR